MIRSLPVTPLDEVAGLVARARAAQPAWEALGFEGRGRVLRRMQKWMVDNADRVIQTIVDESGKTYEDAAVVELSYGAGALGFWAKRAPKYLADEKVRTSNPFVLGRKLRVRYGPAGVVGVIGPVELPADQLLRRRDPGARRRQRRRPQAVAGHAAHLAPARRGRPRVRAAA